MAATSTSRSNSRVGGEDFEGLDSIDRLWPCTALNAVEVARTRSPTRHSTLAPIFERLVLCSDKFMGGC